MNIKKFIISIILLNTFFFQGCRFFDIKENVINNAVLDKTGAFEPVEYIIILDKITGFAFEPTHDNLLVMTEKYQMVSPMSDELKYILNTDSIRDNILPHQKNFTSDTYASVTFESASIKGELIESPKLLELQMIMCFQTALSPEEQTKIEGEIEAFQSFRVSYAGTDEKPCYWLFLTKAGGYIQPIEQAFKVSNYTELKKPIYYHLTMRKLKDNDKLAFQNAIAIGLSPVTTVLDRSYEFAQFIALPLTLGN